MKEHLKNLERSHLFWLFIASSLLFFSLRLPSLFEPYWYGDEGIYETIALALNKGRVLYAQIWDNKPPLLYITYAFVQGNQFAIRLLSLIAGLGALGVLLLLSRKLFSSNRSHIITLTTFAILFGLPTFEGNIANAENFMLIFIITAGFLIYRQSKNTLQTRELLIAGLLLGIAFLYKIVAIFDFTAFLTFLIIHHAPSHIKLHTLLPWIKTSLKPILYFGLGFTLPFGISLLYFLSQGALTDYIRATFLSTIGYVGYGNQFFIPQGLLLTKIAVVLFISGILFLKRKSLPSSFLFIALWIIYSLFNSLFSQRPYTHYLLVLIPSFSLLLGSIAAFKTRLQIIAAVSSLVLAVFSLYFFNHWSITKSALYYANFANFVMGKKSLSAYESFFDRRTPRDSEIVRYINSHASEERSLYLWGNSAQIYYQTQTLPKGKFTVAYHVQGNKKYEEEIFKDLQQDPPQFVVTLQGMPPIPFPLDGYSHVLNVEGSHIYERID